MIVCKPKINVQLVLFAFLFFSYGLTFFFFGKVISRNSSALWLIGSGLMLVISILFSVKILLGYKTLIIDTAQGKASIKYLFRTYIFNIKELSSWEEIEIKTFNNQVFKQIDLVFGKQKVSFGAQEHLGYAQLLQFLKKQGKQKK